MAIPKRSQERKPDEGSLATKACQAARSQDPELESNASAKFDELQDQLEVIYKDVVDTVSRGQETDTAVKRLNEKVNGIESKLENIYDLLKAGRVDSDPSRQAPTVAQEGKRSSGSELSASGAEKAAGEELGPQASGQKGKSEQGVEAGPIAESQPKRDYEGHGARVEKADTSVGTLPESSFFGLP